MHEHETSRRFRVLGHTKRALAPTEYHRTPVNDAARAGICYKTPFETPYQLPIGECRVDVGQRGSGNPYKNLTTSTRLIIACSIEQCERSGRPAHHEETAHAVSLDRGELVPSKAVEALLMKLRISNRAAFLVCTGLAECRVSLEQPVVLFALNNVALRRPGW